MYINNIQTNNLTGLNTQANKLNPQSNNENILSTGNASVFNLSEDSCVIINLDGDPNIVVADGEVGSKSWLTEKIPSELEYKGSKYYSKIKKLMPEEYDEQGRITKLGNNPFSNEWFWGTPYKINYSEDGSFELCSESWNKKWKFDKDGNEISDTAKKEEKQSQIVSSETQSVQPATLSEQKTIKPTEYTKQTEPSYNIDSSDSSADKLSSSSDSSGLDKQRTFKSIFSSIFSNFHSRIQSFLKYLFGNSDELI